MGYTYRFDKILDVKENEKDQARMQFEKSKNEFEKAATHLYELLKNKEDLIGMQEKKLQEGLSVADFKQYQYYIENLEKSIAVWQLKVIEARNKMNIRENHLKNANIEVRKYEKMKEKDYINHMNEEKQIEMINMDEISIQTYMNRVRR